MLVIIGLIVGGVLIGRDLIYAATVQKQITQIRDLETQINTFRVKYNCLPGDCANITSLLGTTDAAGHTIANGDGNGIIQSQIGGGSPYSSTNCLSGDIAGEVAQLFLHLNAAGLGNYTADGGETAPPSPGHGMGVTYPAAAFGNGTGVFVSCLSVGGVYNTFPSSAFTVPGNYMVIGAAPQNGRIVYESGAAQWGNPAYGITPIGLPVDVIQRIDQKTDDGLPNTGVFGIWMGPPSGCLTGSNTYPPLSVSCNVVGGKWIGSGQ